MNHPAAQPQLPEKPTCEQCVMFLSDYIDGTIPLAQSRTFDSHTARCPNCRTFLANYQRIISALLASNPGEIPSLCREPPLRVIEAIRLAIGPRS